MPIRPPAPPPPSPLRSATRHARVRRRMAAVRVCASAPPPPSGPARGLNLTTAYNSGRTNGHGGTGATAATSLVSNSPFHTSLLPPKLPSRRLPPPSTRSTLYRRDPKQLSVLGPCAKLTAHAVQLLAFRSMCERMSGNGAPAVARRSPNPPPPHTTHDACTASESPHRRPHTPGGPFHLDIPPPHTPGGPFHLGSLFR